MKKLVAATCMSVVLLGAGAVSAQDYPPTTQPTATTAASGGLPATGSDTSETMQVAGGVLLAGVGLAGVAWFRRRPAAV